MTIDLKSSIHSGHSSGLMALLIATIISIVTSCAASAPPPPPATSSAVSSSNVKKKTVDYEEEPEVEKTGTESAPEVAEAFLGANIGDDETKKAATDCIKKKNFFDRAGAAPGKCSTLRLADIDCSVEGVRATFTSDADKRAFADKLAEEKYAGFLIDQCIDCVGSRDALCQKDGIGIKGMKILFVKEEAEVIRLQYMIKQ